MIHHEMINPRIFDRLLSMIIYDNIPLNRERGNSGAGRTACYGIVGKRAKPAGPSRWNEKRPEVWAEVQEIAKSLPVPEGWTSCVINQDYVALPHFDSGNTGDSCIVSFGCYSGGDLVLEDASGNRTEVSTFMRPTVGDFSKTRHWTKPLSGFKVSLVYFTISPTRGKKGKIKQAQPTAEEVMKYVDAEHMFNPLPAVSRAKSGRTYVAVETPNPPWAKLNNPKLFEPPSS
jgi:hypothetical protein